MKNIVLFIFSGVTLLSFSQDKINVYFNQTVNNNVSTPYDAIHTTNIQDTIIAHIDRAQVSIDICNYNTSRSDIVEAINNAYSRGVNVRYIGSKDVPFRNTKLSQLNSSINVIQRSGGFPGDDEMHNKFIIVDESSETRATIITGSLNHTNSSIEDDFNNLIVIQDKPLASAYKTEFNEMWGSQTLVPDSGNSKFGSQKTDDTPHSFTIDGKVVELYFSPSDNVISNVNQALQTANSSINVAMMTFKDNLVAQEIITKHNAGVACIVLMNSDVGSSEYSTLVAAGVPTYLNNQSGVLHHKYAIIDGNDSASDPIVITGSQNWNDNTDGSYDDNTLIIHDYKIAQQFLEEFDARKNQIAAINTVAADDKIKIVSNPNEKTLIIDSKLDNARIFLYNSIGQKMITLELKEGENIIQLENLIRGIYIAQITATNFAYSKKIALN